MCAPAGPAPNPDKNVTLRHLFLLFQTKNKTFYGLMILFSIKEMINTVIPGTFWLRS